MTIILTIEFLKICNTILKLNNPNLIVSKQIVIGDSLGWAKKTKVVQSFSASILSYEKSSEIYNFNFFDMC